MPFRFECLYLSTRFLADKLWNELADKLRTSTSTTYFKNNVDLASSLTIGISFFYLPILLSLL